METHIFIHTFHNGTRSVCVCVPGEKIRKKFYGQPPDEDEWRQYGKWIIGELVRLDDIYLKK